MLQANPLSEMTDYGAEVLRGQRSIRDTYQVRFGQVLIFWRVIGRCFPEAVAVTGRFVRLGMLAISGTFRSPAEEVDGFPDTAFNVDLWMQNSKERNVTT